MKNIKYILTFFVLTLVVSLIITRFKNRFSEIRTVINENSYFEQLYLFGETTLPYKCNFIEDEENVQWGAAYFTKKGNVIYYSINMSGDTVSYLYGSYTKKDSSITLKLTNEFYYYGKWDARWDISEPDYTKGKTRKVKVKEITLYKSVCDSNNLYQPYSNAERKVAANRLKGHRFCGLVFFPYTETPNMKFYTWFFKQIPVLANL